MWGHNARPSARWQLRFQYSWDISHLPQHFVGPFVLQQWGSHSCPHPPVLAHRWGVPLQSLARGTGQAQPNAQSTDPGAGVDAAGALRVPGWPRGLQGSSSLAGPHWVLGFGCHCAAFGESPFSSVPRKEMLCTFVASPAPCQCPIHAQLVSPEPADGLKIKQKKRKKII